ncbi:MAG: hypothetical protein QOC81_110 [Thermoanaerobaculia bacterium]|jgi:hypothetical protein|nr:hypothetical protein [Thermoanaerobaculia bacterium]
MKRSPADTYALIIAELVGNEFQLEISARVGANILSFQTVPASPQGDAGLDGFSHAGAQAYCCYGPEHHTYKTNKQREKALIKKFCGDLRKLFELETKGKNLIHKDNPELPTILPKGQKIRRIKLIANWFESHRVIGPILTAVAEYKNASALNFVAADVDVIIAGPTEIANDYPVDELTLARAQQRTFLQKIVASAGALTITDPKDFDSKMQTLREMQPEQADNITALAESLRADWRMSLAFERELGDALPALHETLEVARTQIITRVRILTIGAADPAVHISGATTIAGEILEKDLGKQYGLIIGSVATGEVARLIGECTLGWKKRPVHDAT